ncbi:endonuclease, partial [Achromatium sp. WMS2]
TSWNNVVPAIAKLKTTNNLTPESILDLNPEVLANWIRPAGYCNIKSHRLHNLCRFIIANGGLSNLEQWPTTRLRTNLLAINGIGPETADDILLYAFARPVFVIDTYTKRIAGRLGIIDPKANYETIRNFFKTSLQTKHQDYNELHALLVQHAKQVCRKQPLCTKCCIAHKCAYNVTN